MQKKNQITLISRELGINVYDFNLCNALVLMCLYKISNVISDIIIVSFNLKLFERTNDAWSI